MNIHIYNNATSFAIIYWDDAHEWEDDGFSTIDDALSAVHTEIDERQQALGAHIIDAHTGDIYITCYWDDGSVPEEDYDPWDEAADCEDWDVLEMGFDPYEGFYSFDC